MASAKLGSAANADILMHKIGSLSGSEIATVLVFLIVAALWYLQDFASKKPPAKSSGFKKLPANNGSRNIVEQMKASDKNCVIFFGSQTGFAEDIAARLAKEGHSRFGLRTMLANLEDYDCTNLNEFPSTAVAMFIMATFGEGEPTDNAQDFYNFITADDVTFDNGGSSLSNVKYLSFGLGNSTYEHFNAVSKKIDATLESLGAHRIAPAGRGDDGEKTTEEDFMVWKEPMWKALAQEMNLTERTAVYEPIFDVSELAGLSKSSPAVYLGEPNKLQLQGVLRGPFDSHNPFPAPLAVARQIFKAKDRNCLHMEFDLMGSDLSYETGDHVSILPVNSGVEVDRFLRVFGLESKRDTVVDVKAIERTAKVAFPVPTTYDTIVRYRLEIGASVSRQFIQQLSNYAPTADVREEMEKLGNDKDYFHSQITERELNISQTLELVAQGATWENVPFSMLLESLVALQPRIYSISSSSLALKHRLSITTKVETHPIASTDLCFKGVATNYLLALEQKHNNVSSRDPYAARYTVDPPRKHYDGVRVAMYIRPSTFRLPASTTTPIIMVGPGTGVAPFRAFVQERSEQRKAGLDVGLTMLFFGCRKQKEDFIYEEEWAEYGRILGSNFRMITAFSRQTPSKKVYVQDKIRQFGAEISSLLSKDAHFYVCGDAAMAKDVSSLLEQIISERRAVPPAEAAAVVKQMRAANQYQEDAWS
ncbi:hypothetical protein AYO21_09735 [Fonsecaea monophora]|uniref:NADPH--cytochrome P450 reductase n=1 Tax=Fonsecaea monophora TaxID=254056 RepID=A0A177EVY1_9EURO|nr:hypothetical protein AYO21_09735 [Fonsecaea monophora]KAH0835082.1 NADPH--cytochrome P450 reductase [Fonsecaea pedrosoi]OAG36108.1 hypothetical protein AYO21_09735 [Fonsecaea monophora]